MANDKNKPLTEKAKSAWAAIMASGDAKLKYHGCGGIKLSTGERINGHIVHSLENAALISRVTYNHETGETIDKEFGWHFVITEKGRTEVL